MKPVSRDLAVSLLTRILVIVIIAKSLGLALLWFLPGEGVNHTAAASVQPDYFRYGIDTMLENGTPRRSAALPTGVSSGRTSSVGDLVLKGLYGKGTTGYVIIALKARANKTEVIGIGETFEGYTLLSIQQYDATFERQGAHHTVAIEESAPRPKSPAVRESPVVDEGPRQIPRDQVEAYTSNLDQIWRDITVQEVTEDGKITGFKVTKIRPNTPFATLGLQKGDIIVKANNRVLDSYATAMDIYKEIGTLRAIELLILRNNQEKEIIYEID